MSWVLQALARLLSGEPAPGTPEHRAALFRSVKERNEELSKPPEQRNQGRLLEVTQRNLRLRAQSCRVNKEGIVVGTLAGRLASASAWRHGAAARQRSGAAAAGCLLPKGCICRQAILLLLLLLLHLQAKQQQLTRSVDVLLQPPSVECCPDCLRVRQRLLASCQARAAWFEAWALLSTRRLEALEEGRLCPVVSLPCLQLEPHLPDGMPEELPPSIERCSVCQQKLEQVRGWCYGSWVDRVERSRLQSGEGQ